MKVIAGLLNSVLANKLGYKTKVLANCNWNRGVKLNGQRQDE